MFSVLVVTLLIPGCNAGRISDENTRLRREHLELTEQLADQRARYDRLKAQTDALAARQNQTAPAVPGVKPSDIPVATRITLGRYSGALDEDGDGKDDTIRLYVLTEDQKGRFIPVAGRAVVQVVVIEPNEAVRELARKTYDPKALDEAFTSGLTGTHYTFELSVAPAEGTANREVTVKVTLVDAATGASMAAQTVVELSASR